MVAVVEADVILVISESCSQLLLLMVDGSRRSA